MGICPLCNGFESPNYDCETCAKTLIDKGRLLDYFDDYSAYLEIDGMKLFDGIEGDAKNHQCPHLFFCTNCERESTILIQEI